MMGATGEPSGYYPMDSNGLMVQSELPLACVCQVALVPMVCPPLGYGGCEGRCEEAPPILPPIPSPSPGPCPSPELPDDSLIIPAGIAGLFIGLIIIAIRYYLASCAAAAAGGGFGALRACRIIRVNSVLSKRVGCAAVSGAAADGGSRLGISPFPMEWRCSL